MYRRAVLVTLAGLSGCAGLSPLGGGSDEASSDPGGTGGETPAGEPTGTPAGGAAGTPGTPTATGTPSTAELNRMDVAQLLDLARSLAGQAVTAYVGGDGSLTDVSASTDTFDPSPVTELLYRAKAAYEAADRQGISAEQEETIQRLRRFEGFVRLAVDAQVLLVGAHTDLEDLVAATDNVEPETAASIPGRVDRRQARTSRAVSELSRTKYARSVGVVDRLSRAEYDDKRLQFETEAEVLGQMVDAVDGVVEGVGLLSRARGRRQSGAPYAAAELARDAEAAFVSGTNAIEEVLGGVSPQGRGFSGVGNDLLSAAEDRRSEARALHVDVA
jgi:hypothetical protein